MNRPLPRHLTAALPTLLILAGAFLRIRIALDRPLWDDELWQRFVTREGSYLDFILWRHDESVHPPLSFILTVIGVTFCYKVMFPITLAFQIGRASCRERVWR